MCCSSSAFPVISVGFTILFLLRSQLELWNSSLFFFFFCVPSLISGLHHSSSFSSTFPARSLGFTILLLLRSPVISVGFTILLLLLRSRLDLWASPFFSFFYIPSNISGVHHSYSSSTFPAISQGFTILLLLLRSQRSGVHHFW